MLTNKLYEEFITLNPINKISNYGFKESITFDVINWNGHCKGAIVCKVNNNTGELEESYIPKDEDCSKARQMLKDKSIKLIQEPSIYKDKDITYYYLPYVPKNHTTLKPTISNYNISTTERRGYYWRGKLEVLLVTEDRLKRYLVMPFESVDVCLFDILDNNFKSHSSFINSFNSAGSNLKVKKDFSDKTGNQGYKIDFYDNTGKDYYLNMDLQELKECISSFRLIELNLIKMNTKV